MSCVVFAYLCVMNIIEMWRVYCKKANRILCILCLAFCISHFAFRNYLWGCFIFPAHCANCKPPKNVVRFCNCTHIDLQLRQLMSARSIKPNWPVKCSRFWVIFFRLHCAYDTLHGNWSWAASRGRVKCSLNTHKMCPVYTGGPLRSVQTAAHYVYARWAQWKYLLQQIAVVVKCRLQGCKAWHFFVASLNVLMKICCPIRIRNENFISFTVCHLFCRLQRLIDWNVCCQLIDDMQRGVLHVPYASHKWGFYFKLI